MIRIQKILFTTDFSECANRALGHAVVMAQRYKARLVLLHVRTLIEDDANNPTMSFPGAMEYRRALEQTATHRLDELGESIESQLHAEKVVERGISSAERIIDFAMQNAVDLIVMGTHGRSGLSHLLLGSVAEKVVRFAPCPVMTVGKDEGHFPKRRTYSRILVPIDFSENSVKALRYGLQFATAYKARLDLLHVIESANQPAAYYNAQLPATKPVSEIVASGRREMDRLWAREIPVNVDCSSEVAIGRVHREIADYAKKNFLDLIVMGTHGLSGFERLLMGSVTEKVVRAANCPVLTVKMAEREIIETADLHAEAA